MSVIRTFRAVVSFTSGPRSFFRDIELEDEEAAVLNAFFVTHDRDDDPLDDLRDDDYELYERIANHFIFAAESEAAMETRRSAWRRGYYDHSVSVNGLRIYLVEDE